MKTYLYACPNCRYVVTSIVIRRDKLDYDCPRCGKHTLSEFVSPGLVKLFKVIDKNVKKLRGVISSFESVVDEAAMKFGKLAETLKRTEWDG